jgi:hypothetical protein
MGENGENTDRPPYPYKGILEYYEYNTGFSRIEAECYDYMFQDLRLLHGMRIYKKNYANYVRSTHYLCDMLNLGDGSWYMLLGVGGIYVIGKFFYNY